MALGLIGRKRGMTRVYTEAGDAVPVTVIEIEPNRVTRVKTVDTDGYRAVQITTGSKHRNRITKPEGGEFTKQSIEAGRGLWEFRLADGEGAELAAGAELKADLFAAGVLVDVTGVTIGKGFAGTIKRHNFGSGRASHGNSRSHNVPGSIGMAQDPGRVFPGKRMSGHLGAVASTVQNLEIARVDAERGLLMVRGAVPGSKNGNVVVTPAVRARAPGKRAANLA